MAKRREPTAMSQLPKLIMPALLIVALYYATFGGEYSIFELRSARAAVTEEQAALGELQARIDSLSAWADSVRSDPGTLERIAREQFGMIREGERLYRFVPEAGEEEQR
jgi:cell division protein FtsB